jgi:peroxiredoxin
MRIYVDFGKRHPNSYYGQDIIFRNRKSIPRDTLVKLYNSMSPQLKANQKGQGLKLFLYSTIVQKGKPMIDFEVKTIDGKPFKLSSLKGKYIYLTFGSIGCGPCRKENKALAANYSKLSPLVSLVTFSLDRNVTEWKKMTKEDGIVWNNISDMKGDGDVKILYNVQSIPAAFLIDKQGIIIERYDGYSDTLINEIEKKVKEL